MDDYEVEEDGEDEGGVLQISPDGTFVRTDSRDTRLQLDYDPTCVEIFEVQGVIFIFASTFGLNTYILKVDENGKLHSVMEGSMHNATADNTRIVIDGAALLSSGEDVVVACATRSRYLLSSVISLHHLGRYQVRGMMTCC